MTCAQFVALVLLAGALLGCAPALHIEKVSAPLPTYERVTMEEALREEVANSPVSFVLNHYESNYAWERAKIFFKEHTTGFLGERKVSPDKLLLSNIESAKDKYVYEVERSRSAEGFRYHITCFSNEFAGLDQSQVNARNLARFIRMGQLERSLLEG